MCVPSLHPDIGGTPLRSKFETIPYAEKALFTALWNAHIILNFLDQRAQKNANCCCTSLRYLKEISWLKCLALLIQKVNLLYNSAHHSTACITTKLMKQFQWKCLVHPPYNPDLLHSNLQLSDHWRSTLKENIPCTMIRWKLRCAGEWKHRALICSAGIEQVL
jgi:hypothetical protein